MTGRNGSSEMMLHRRPGKKMDIRGDDSTVLNDSVLVGGLVDKVGEATEMKVGRASTQFHMCPSYRGIPTACS